jgi:hypothetical protein
MSNIHAFNFVLAFCSQQQCMTCFQSATAYPFGSLPVYFGLPKLPVFKFPVSSSLPVFKFTVVFRSPVNEEIVHLLKGSCHILPAVAKFCHCPSVVLVEWLLAAFWLQRRLAGFLLAACWLSVVCLEHCVDHRSTALTIGSGSGVSPSPVPESSVSLWL